MYGVISGEWIKGAAYPSRPKPWVARITAPHPKFKYTREFIKGVFDYSYVHTRNAGRGIYLYFNCAPGLHEMYRPVSWNPNSDERFFFKVFESGNIKQITEAQLQECLKNADLA